MASARIRRPWRGKHAWRPNSVCRFYAGDILELQSADFVPEPRLNAVAGVDDHDTAWQARRAGPFDLLQRDLWFCLEFYVFGYTRFLSPRLIVGPGLRQVQSIRDGQTRVIVGDRQRNCYLAIVLLAELSAILPRDADRVLALLGKTRVVDDPRRNGAVHLNIRDRLCTNALHYGLVRPISLADKMQQRLVLCCRSRRRRQCCYGLDALALRRQQQARAIADHCRNTPSVPQHAGQIGKIGRKAAGATPAAHVVFHDSSWS